VHKGDNARCSGNWNRHIVVFVFCIEYKLIVLSSLVELNAHLEDVRLFQILLKRSDVE
jgi:hypothetical protein